MPGIYHKTVMAQEAVDLLNCHPGGIYVDATIGGGGHGQKILEKIKDTGLLIGLDRDSAAIEYCTKFFSAHKNVILKKTNFADLAKILTDLNLKKIDGIIFDLGVSDEQFSRPQRGFSFRQEGPLDMRMDSEAEVTAKDLVNNLSAGQLEKILWEYGQERWTKKIVAQIIVRRSKKEITTTHELAQIIASSIPRSKWPENIHPATRTFQALRIAVNNELLILKETFAVAADYLNSLGRMVVISFHSLEDRLTKEAFKVLAAGCICPSDLPQCVCGHKPLVRVITKKPIQPSQEEITQNPHSRSAKMRVVERLPVNGS